MILISSSIVSWYSILPVTYVRNAGLPADIIDSKSEDLPFLEYL
jgi:hypothetical protein